MTMVMLQIGQPRRILGREKIHTWAVMMRGFHPKRTRKEGNRFAVEHQYTAVDKPCDAIDKPFTLKDE